MDPMGFFSFPDFLSAIVAGADGHLILVTIWFFWFHALKKFCLIQHRGVLEVGFGGPQIFSSGTVNGTAGGDGPAGTVL